MNNWFMQSMIAMLCLVPAWLAVGFFAQNYQVKPDVFLIWYFLGIIISSVLFSGSSFNEIMPSMKFVAAILLIGGTIGAISNILLFRAVTIAPNPGLPVAIVNATSIGVFLAAGLLSKLAPNYFNSEKIDAWSLFGIILTIVGTSIIAIRK